MNNFYFHYLSYIDTLGIGIKEAVLKDNSLASKLYMSEDKKDIKELLQSFCKSEKELNENCESIASAYIKEKACKDYERLGDIRFIPYFSEEYPYKLKNIYNPPLGLYVKGKLPDENIPTLAVIGARNCTEYGAKWTKAYTSEFCEKGIQIISGMARGIDGIAGRISVRYKDLSYAVLGSGINVCYPPSNRDLYESLKTKGSLISEYPPDVKAASFRFPFRNRIISGLSDAVFVAEAALKSGSHITAYFALEQGKDVFALPGNVDSSLSKGTNNLIKKGAFPALSAEDIWNSFYGFK